MTEETYLVVSYAGFVSKKIVIGKSKNQILKLVGLAIQFGMTTLISKKFYQDYTKGFYLQIFKRLNTILIELQPKCNAKMLFTSHVLYGKLVELYKDTDVTIRFVRASQKLKAYTGPEIKCTLKGKYAQRKWLSIKYGEWFLENKFSQEQRDKWKPTLIGKLDDRMDTLLMVINAITGIPKKQITNKKGKCIK